MDLSRIWTLNPWISSHPLCHLSYEPLKKFLFFYDFFVFFLYLIVDSLIIFSLSDQFFDFIKAWKLHKALDEEYY